MDSAPTIARALRAVALSLLLLAGNAVAGDFRVADIGESCATIEEQELALGSEKTQPKGVVTYAFNAHAFGHDVLINYVCTHGTLLAGDYLLETQPVDDVFATFEDVYKQLTAIYGDPILGETAWKKPGKERTRMPGIMMRTMTTWNTPRVSITAVILPLADSVGGGYKVALHFGGSLDNVKSENNSK